MFEELGDGNGLVAQLIDAMVVDRDASGPSAAMLAAAPPVRLSGAMTKAGTTGGSTPPRSVGREPRTERLATALKANLRRRKAQARQRAAEAGAPKHAAEDAESAAAHDSARVVVDKRPA
jgi:hypothetical protein